MYKENKEKLVWSGSIIIEGDNIYKPDLYIYQDDKSKFEDRRLDTCWLDGDYFYKYMGDLDPNDVTDKTPPGIYGNIKGEETFLVEPRTDEEKMACAYEDKLSCVETEDIVALVNTKGNAILKTINESSKSSVPPITDDDDILKRLMKEALIIKQIDPNSCKDLFNTRNESFNFNSGLKSKNKFSMLLFSRGCKAFKLKCTIQLEDLDPDNIVGNPITEPIVCSSEDIIEHSV